MPTHHSLLRRIAVLLLPLAALLSAPSPAWSPETEGPRGHLIIVGGGDTPPEAQQRFVELAGGPGRARIALFPMASVSGNEEAAEAAEELARLGAEVHIVDLDRDSAQAEHNAMKLSGMSGFWFCGGDQTRLATILRDTPALNSVQRRYYEGAVVGGTSAGAAVMSRRMLTGKHQSETGDASRLPPIARNLIETDDGFGFLPGAIVDQHFLQRSRHNRLLSAVLERPGSLGIGIDEGTALLVRPDRRWEVIGDSYVKIFDARRARIAPSETQVIGSSDITMHLLPGGSLYDPISGQTVLPAL